MLPAASTSSGSTGSNWYPAVSKLMMWCPDPRPSWQQRGGLDGRHCSGIVVDELLHRGRRHVEHGLRIDAEQDGERDQWHQRQAFAEGEILDARERGFYQRAEDHLAIE